jgi:hypothetical protein
VIREVSRGQYRLSDIPVTIAEIPTARHTAHMTIGLERIARALRLDSLHWLNQEETWHFELDATLVTLLDASGSRALIEHRAIARPGSGTRTYKWIVDGDGHNIEDFQSTASCPHKLVPFKDGRGRFALEQRFECIPAQRIEFALTYVASQMFTNREEFWGCRARYPTDIMEIAVAFPAERLPVAHRTTCATEDEERMFVLAELPEWDESSSRLAWRISSPGHMLAHTLHWTW